jgi:hypothetical protein
MEDSALHGDMCVCMYVCGCVCECMCACVTVCVHFSMRALESMSLHLVSGKCRSTLLRTMICVFVCMCVCLSQCVHTTKPRDPYSAKGYKMTDAFLMERSGIVPFHLCQDGWAGRRPTPQEIRYEFTQSHYIGCLEEHTIESPGIFGK